MRLILRTILSIPEGLLITSNVEEDGMKRICSYHLFFLKTRLLFANILLRKFPSTIRLQARNEHVTQEVQKRLLEAKSKQYLPEHR